MQYRHDFFSMPEFIPIHQPRFRISAMPFPPIVTGSMALIGERLGKVVKKVPEHDAPAPDNIYR
jgi:hypothetical protein